MKKTMMFLGVLSLGLAHAQQYDGKVGVNTHEPTATLEIKASMEDGSRKEGLLIPRMSKANLAKIADPTVSTLIYVNEATTYTAGADANADNRVTNVDAVGFYHYNGTQWVKHIDTNSELWAQRDASGVTETYLKPATANNDEYMYSPKKSYINLGNAQDIVGATGFKYLNAKKDVPNLLMISSAALPAGNTALGQYGKRYTPFSREVYVVNQDSRHSTGEIMKYFGRELNLQAKNLNYKIGYLIGNETSVDFQSSSETVQLVGGRFTASAGDLQGTTSPVITSKMIGLHSTPGLFSGKTIDLVGTYNELNTVGGTIDNLIGTENKVHTSVVDTNTNKEFKDVLGTRSNVKITTNSTANRLYGHLSYTNFDAQSNIKSEAAGIATSAYIKAGSTIKSFMGVRSYINAEPGANVTDIYGFRFQEDLQDGFEPENLYGLHIGSVKRGKVNNFSIYTDGDGQVRIGDLADLSSNPRTDNRLVYADPNGVLKLGEATNVKLGNANTCNTDNTGTIRFKDDKFQGCTSKGWKDLHL